MKMEEYFVMEEQVFPSGEVVQCFCPLEFDGEQITVVSGMNYLLPLEEMQKKAKKIWKVESIETLKNPVLIYERSI
jgi:hypothetical protein